MDNKILAWASGYLQEQRRRRKWHKVVQVLAAVVVFCTTYALILPAITLEHGPVCGQEEHVHTEECYTEERTLICGKEETEGHFHTEECYQAEPVLICGQEESEEHTHTEECYQTEQRLICGQEESEGHTHTEECYQTERLLSCGKEEHTHSADCYAETTETAPVSDPAADVETQGDWERTLACVTLTGDWSEDLLAVAESQLGYTESADNFVVDADGSVRGYSRYGAWYGDPYGHWCAMFVSFCLHYAEVEGVPAEANCERWIAELSSEEYQIYRTPDTYTPKSGDLIFFDMDADTVSDHVGIVKEILPASGETPAMVRTIEGNSGDRVQYMAYELADKKIMGYGVLPEEPEEGPDAGMSASGAAENGSTENPRETGEVYAYEDDAIAVEVTLPADSTVPADAILSVQAIADTDVSYGELARQAETAVTGETGAIALYDISFYTSDGQYLPVADNATVSLHFKETVIAEGDTEVAVLHYKEEADLPAALEEVDVERDENDALSSLTFQTEGFSIYAVVEVKSLGYEPLTDITDLDGKELAILSNTGKYAMRAEDCEDGNGRLAEAVTATSDWSQYVVWKFEASEETGGYYISSGGQYLKMDGGSLLFADSRAEADAFAVSLFDTDGHVLLRAENGNYLNLYGGETKPTGFKGWAGTDGGSQQMLYQIAENTEDEDSVLNLDGQTFAIVNQTNGSYAITSTYQEVNGVDGLQGKSVQVTTNGNFSYIEGDGITQWTFHAVEGKPGVYTISADESGQYMYLGATPYDSSNDGRGSLTLSDTPQEISVTATADGKVTLEANKGNVNLDMSTYHFWTYNEIGNDGSSKHTLARVIEDDYLFYDLNLAASVSEHMLSNGNWRVNNSTSTAPSIASSIQEFGTEGGTLYSVKGIDPSTGYYTYCGLESIIGVRNYLYNQGKTYGKELRFDGWQATVGEAKYLFAENAAAEQKNDGIHITDVDGVERVLPVGTTLVGQWTEVSDLVQFYVNYSGTILDKEGDVSGRNQKEFTGVIGIGHIYYGKKTVGNDTVFATEANEDIKLTFAGDFDPDNPKTQIVMDFVSTCSTDADGTVSVDFYNAAPGINPTELEKALLQYIHDNPGETIKVSTADNQNNPVIDQENATTDNYSVRWYVLKEQSDSWHIDGVMVAKTAEMSIVKTFSGLEDTQVKALLGDSTEAGTYSIPVKLGEEKPQDYLTITTQEISGQYSYGGQLQDGHSYHWTLNAITDEFYTLSEEGYGVDGYDVSTIVVHYYTDEDGKTEVDYAYDTSTENLEAGSKVKGGKSTAVSFNNYYTKTGTGALAIAKLDESMSDYDSSAKLDGAVFTLYDEDENKIGTSKTNFNGSAYFNNLEPGTYTLEETTPPTGYISSDLTWTVVVERNAENNVTVTVYENDENGDKTGNGTVCYDKENGGVVWNYPIKNTPQANTVTVTKSFSGLTSSELQKIVANSSEEGTDPYHICLKGNVSGSGVVDAEGETNATLYLSDASMSQDGMSFTWKVTNLQVANEDDSAIGYSIEEYNYLIDEYADTVVGVKLNGAEQEVYIDRSVSLAGVSNVKFNTDQSDTVEITNHYTNTFDLKLQKVDSVTNEPLANAVFDIYGPYRESTNTGKRYTYTDSDGNSHTYYFIGQITSGEDGIAVWPGLTLSQGDNTFLYVFSEFESPNEYVRLETPIIASVTVNTEEYDNGVYSIQAPNTKERDAILTLKTEKIWNPRAPEGKTVTLQLYRVEHTERGVPLDEVADAALVEEVTLDGEPDALPGNTGDPPGEDTATAEDPSGEGTVAAEDPSGKDTAAAEDSSGEDTAAADDPSGEDTAAAGDPSGEDTAAADDSSGEDTAAADDPSGEDTTAAEDSSGEGAATAAPAAYESEPWVASWINIPAAAQNDPEQEEPAPHYHYFVREISAIEGYITTYASYELYAGEKQGQLEDEDALQLIRVTDQAGNTEIFEAVLLADMAEDYLVEITNTEKYKLPESGGTGTRWTTIGGLLLTAGSLLYGYWLRRKRERRSRN